MNILSKCKKGFKGNGSVLFQSIVLFSCVSLPLALSGSEEVDISFVEWQENFKQLAIEQGIHRKITD